MKKNSLDPFFATLFALSLLFSACAPTASGNTTKSNKHREMKPAVPEEDVHNLVGGNNAFAVDIYQALRSESGNLILSPYSISLALAMTYAGARGETGSQMAGTLHFNQTRDQLHPAFNALDLALEETPTSLDKDQEPLKLNIANAVWAEQTFPFLQEFLDTLAVNYGAGIHLADFIEQFEPARKEINYWVSDQTEDKINDLLPDGSLNSNTRMVLVNAIYFKADWLAPFDADSTGDGQFHLLDGSEVAVAMMHQGMYIPYMQGRGYQAIELGYAGETTAMDIIVPDQGNFEAFDSSFIKGRFDEIITGVQPASVSLSLPKFEFDKGSNLSETLKGMGMTNAFENNMADFSGMTGGKDLFIGNVFHKAYVAVDEEGTEAAAATAVIMEVTSAPIYDVNLQVDRPFIFIIRDTINGQILFIGRVTDPSQ